MQARILSNGQLDFAGPWLEDRQRCDDFLIEVHLAIRKYHHQKTQGPQLQLPDEQQVEALIR